MDNYKVAVETADKCCQANAQFAEISEVCNRGKRQYLMLRSCPGLAMTGRVSGRVKHPQLLAAVLIVIIVLRASFNGAPFILNVVFGVFLPESQGKKLQGLQRPVG